MLAQKTVYTDSAGISGALGNSKKTNTSRVAENVFYQRFPTGLNARLDCAKSRTQCRVRLLLTANALKRPSALRKHELTNIDGYQLMIYVAVQ